MTPLFSSHMCSDMVLSVQCEVLNQKTRTYLVKTDNISHWSTTNETWFLNWFFLFYLFSDNPLICSCELIWFPNLLKELKNRDDEMTQKKRPMCTMLAEHREYFVQNMPLERMNCIGKNLGRSAMSSAGNTKRLMEMVVAFVAGLGMCFA